MDVSSDPCVILLINLKLFLRKKSCLDATLSKKNVASLNMENNPMSMNTVVLVLWLCCSMWVVGYIKINYRNPFI